MKRYGNLFDGLCSFENLLKASKKAQKGKRFKSSTGNFNLKLEDELLSIQQELLTQTYQMGNYKRFYIYDPKKRLISAAPYRDRVVQHALCNIIEPIFDKLFIFDTYACRKNKGSHQAVARFKRFCRSNNYVLKCDIKNYFASINHGILYQLILRKIKDTKVLWLIKRIIDSTSSPGVPIGNLTSQIFANLYLNELDCFIKGTLKCKCYVRYMDDMAIFGKDKVELSRIKLAIRDYLVKLKLKLHENKSQIYKTRKVNFLGYRVFPTHCLIMNQNLVRLKRRMEKYLKLCKDGVIEKAKIINSLQSWLGYAVHADSYKLRMQIIAQMEGVIL